jgi:hypothetical protein
MSSAVTSVILQDLARSPRTCVVVVLVGFDGKAANGHRWRLAVSPPCGSRNKLGFRHIVVNSKHSAPGADARTMAVEHVRCSAVQ